MTEPDRHAAYCRVSAQAIADLLKLPEGAHVIGIGWEPRTESVQLFVEHPALPEYTRGTAMEQVAVIIHERIDQNVLVPERSFKSEWVLPEKTQTVAARIFDPRLS